jgi:cytochrome c oxidase subunit II
MTRRVAALICVLSSVIATSPDSAAAPQQAEPRVIEVVARRYAFEPPQIDVTQGERIRIVLTTADGLHGFEIKKFKIAKEVPRGSKPIVIDFTADEARQFPIVCSAYCGDGHESMKGMLVVQAREKD